MVESYICHQPGSECGLGPLVVCTAAKCVSARLQEHIAGMQGRYILAWALAAAVRCIGTGRHIYILSSSCTTRRPTSPQQDRIDKERDHPPTQTHTHAPLSTPPLTTARSPPIPPIRPLLISLGGYWEPGKAHPLIPCNMAALWLQHKPAGDLPAY
jgi:hypothetical protein